MREKLYLFWFLSTCSYFNWGTSRIWNCKSWSYYIVNMFVPQKWYFLETQFHKYYLYLKLKWHNLKHVCVLVDFAVHVVPKSLLSKFETLKRRGLHVKIEKYLFLKIPTYLQFQPKTVPKTSWKFYILQANWSGSCEKKQATPKLPGPGPPDLDRIFLPNYAFYELMASPIQSV